MGFMLIEVNAAGYHVGRKLVSISIREKGSRSLVLRLKPVSS